MVNQGAAMNQAATGQQVLYARVVPGATAAGGGQTVAPPMGQQPAAQKTVTVESGDFLIKIAEKHGVDWKQLYELNKDVIGDNPNLIKPGMELKLP